MTVHELSFPGPLLLIPSVHVDSRGCLIETWKHSALQKAGIHSPFVQENLSVSALGVLRGLHYQTGLYAQGKLVRVVRGKAFSVALNLVEGSAHFGMHCGVFLDAVEHHMLWLPPGFAHGFLSMEDNTHLVYSLTSEYSPQHEAGIAYNDATLAIAWPGPVLQVSPKDAALPAFAQAVPSGVFSKNV